MEDFLQQLTKQKEELGSDRILAGNKLKNSFLREYVRMLKKYYYYNDTDILEAVLKIDELVESKEIVI